MGGEAASRPPLVEIVKEYPEPLLVAQILDDSVPQLDKVMPVEEFRDLARVQALLRRQRSTPLKLLSDPRCEFHDAFSEVALRDVYILSVGVLQRAVCLKQAMVANVALPVDFEDFVACFQE